MNFLADYTKLNDLLGTNRTWKLLRADRAPMIIAFLKNLFANETEVPYGTARANLIEFLKQIEPELDKENFENIVTSKSSDLLREWINNGWLTELNNCITLTDSSQRALDFCNLLVNRTVNTSATHLQIFLNELQQLYVRIGIDKKAKTSELIKQKKELEEEIRLIREGRQIPLTEPQKKERIRTLYDLASRLPRDFRKLEEETREIDRRIRVRMIEENTTKGNLLKRVLKEEAEQRQTDYGSAYEGFFKMLCDSEVVDKFKSQMAFVLSQPIAQYLNKNEISFLKKMIPVLLSECQHVQDVRSRIDENLRMYVESSDFQENRTVTELLSKLERFGVMLKDTTSNLQRERLDIKLEGGGIKVCSIENFRIKRPDEITDYSGVQEHQNSSVISNHIIKSLDTVRIKDVRDSIRRTLGRASSMTVAEIISKNKILYGLQEVVAYVRVANELKAELKSIIINTYDYKCDGIEGYYFCDNGENIECNYSYCCRGESDTDWCIILSIFTSISVSTYKQCNIITTSDWQVTKKARLIKASHTLFSLY